MYRQVKIKRGGTTQVTWVPEKFAVKGKTLKLRQTRGLGCVRGTTPWDDGWVVVEVYNTRMTEEEAVAGSRDYLRQRKASDI